MNFFAFLKDFHASGRQKEGVTIRREHFMNSVFVNPLRPNSDLTQTSHCNIKGLSVSEVMRIENMITQVQFY